MGTAALVESRLATDIDLQFTYETFMDPVSNPYLSYDMMDIASFKVIFEELLMEGGFHVCYDGNKKIGTYGIYAKKYRQAHCWYMGAFAVHKKAKGKGYSKLMLEHIIGKARITGKKRIELGVSSHNTLAINLYRKFGFQIEGRIKRSYRINNRGKFYDELIMGLLL